MPSDPAALLRALDKKATPGPWSPEPEATPYSGGTWEVGSARGAILAAWPGDVGVDGAEQNAGAVATLRNALPALADYIEALERFSGALYDGQGTQQLQDAAETTRAALLSALGGGE